MPSFKIRMTRACYVHVWDLSSGLGFNSLENIMKTDCYIIHKTNLSKLLNTITVAHIWLYVCVHYITNKYTYKNLLLYT